MQTVRLAFAAMIAIVAAEGSIEASEPTSFMSRIAIFAEPGLPVRGCPSSADNIRQILESDTIQVEVMSARELADPSVLNPHRIAILVIPTGETFPVAARQNLIRYLHSGGDLISTGGYAFNHLVRQVDGRWVSESDWIQDQFKRAKETARSLILDPGFERSEAIPIGSTSQMGAWCRTDEQCELTSNSPHDGHQCARIILPPDHAATSGGFAATFPVTAGRTYLVSGHLRAENLAGPGIAYMAIYQNDKNGQMVEFRDFGIVRKSTNWRRFQYEFTPKATVTTALLKCGFFRKQGTAWFDNFQVIDVTGTRFKAINTSTGKPEDGLIVERDQLGIFDASFPLKRARKLRTAPEQLVVSATTQWDHPFTGWGASGVLGNDHARWIPILETNDRYGRRRGAAAAVLLNYDGYFSGSSWAYFGIDNVDLFSDPDGPLAESLRQVTRFLLRAAFLHNLQTDRRLYRAGEPIHTSILVDNRGTDAQHVQVSFFLEDQTGQLLTNRVDQLASVLPGEAERVEADLGPIPLHDSNELYRVKAVLSIAGRPCDQMQTGVVKERPETLKSGPTLRFSQNYFRLNGRPMFLFGTDTYARTYMSAAENPWTWNEELSAARDMGVNIYENLQYNRKDHAMTENDWQDFRAMAQLTQRHQLVFMPGMLIGHNTAIGADLLSEQSDQCRNYARHLGTTPGLLYYINGDYVLRTETHVAEVKTLWANWLQSRYRSISKLKATWKPAVTADDWDKIPFPPPNSARWDDVPTLDLSRFRNWLTTRWNRAHVAAIREVDTDHPTTSEYYSKPSDGIDLPMTIDTQDVANIGFFERPGDDLNALPLRICFNDLRARGKGSSLGEYGVKTHPAWQENNGATGYHICRTEQQQNQLFAAVAHYALGLGCCKVQNWCLRDGQTRVFPWGIFYPNQMIPKDVAYLHRNQSLIWRFMTPVDGSPPLTVCLSNHLRMGNDASLGTDVAYRTLADLLALHLPFNCIDDGHLASLPKTTKVLFYPSPMALSDEAFGALLAWVEDGGVLFFTGDISFDENRQYTRTDRLPALAGVRAVSENFRHVARHTVEPVSAEFKFAKSFRGSVQPRIDIAPTTADVVARSLDGKPVMVRNRVGKGRVFFCTDPMELAADSASMALRRQLYAAVAKATGLQRLPVKPDVPWLHVMRQPTARGNVQVVFNTRSDPGQATLQLPTSAGDVTLQARNGWPVLVTSTNAGKIVIVNSCGTASVQNELLVGGRGLKAVLSLDGEDLRRSTAVLIAPFESGQVVLKERAGSDIAIVGEFSEGKWIEFERIDLSDGRLQVDIDEDRATTLILVCQKSNVRRWTKYLEDAFCRPDQIDGY